MQILKGTVIDWRERRLISKLYMDQSVKTKTGPGRDKKCEDWKRR